MHDDPGYRSSPPRPGAGQNCAEGSLAEADPAAQNEPTLGAAPESNEGEGSSGTPADISAPEEELLPNFRLNKVYEDRVNQTNPLTDWRWLLVTALVAALGVGAGYVFARANPPVVPVPVQPTKLLANSLSDQVQAQVDAAFQEVKQGRYQEGHDQFIALREQHPEWWPLDIEAARASLYRHDLLEAQRALHGIPPGQGLSDQDFVLGLLHLTNQELELAAASFASAAARNPARPDVYYFWGECLRRIGKPREAAEKFHSALLRNQYEYAEGLYQLKLWLSQIQADQEKSSGASAAINKALASPRPPYEALFAAAAREIKTKHFKEAADFLSRAQGITEPSVFRVIMQDPSFVEESTRPELAPFYK